jgi:hypothetical protein
MFINSAMVIFLLPLAFFRFFWWRFNVWGELAAIVLGLPLSVLVWFVLDFQNESRHSMWQGLSLLFGLSFLVLITVTLLTPAESKETLAAFYNRCRPPGFWGPVRALAEQPAGPVPSSSGIIFNSALGILACFGLVLATNAVFVGDWLKVLIGMAASILLGGWLIARVFEPEPTVSSQREEGRHDDLPPEPNKLNQTLLP